MKQTNSAFLIFTTFLTFTSLFSFAQKIGIDIKQDWFAEVPTIDMAQLDTIVVYPLKGNISNTKDVLVWHFQDGMDYQLKMYNNSNPALVGDPYTFAPEYWRLKEKRKDELYLSAKEDKDPRPFHKKVSVYKLLLFRDDYNILYKMILVKQYNNRYHQQINGPDLIN